MTATDTRTAAAVFAVLGTAVLLAGGCAGSEPPVLDVAGIGYSADELGLLAHEHRHRLAALTAFGAAVARDELDTIGRPVIDRERERLLARRVADELAARELGIQDDVLRERYEADPEPELVVRHILIEAGRWQSAEQRAEAGQAAAEARERALAGEEFPDLAAELSDEPGADRRGGLLQPGRAGTWVDPFWEAAVRLDVGEISDVVETQYGYHVLRLDERRPVPFEEARERVLRRVLTERSAPGRDPFDATDSLTRELRVDTAAVGAWRAGNAAADSTLLARWPGGEYAARDFGGYIAALDPEERTRIDGMELPALTTVVYDAAREALLAERADGVGVTVASAEIDAAAAAWDERAQRLAETLGFATGQDPAQVKAAAMAALGARNQDVHIARTRIFTLRHLLHSAYPVVSDEREG